MVRRASARKGLGVEGPLRAFDACRKGKDYLPAASTSVSARGPQLLWRNRLEHRAQPELEKQAAGSPAAQPDEIYRTCDSLRFTAIHCDSLRFTAIPMRFTEQTQPMLYCQHRIPYASTHSTKKRNLFKCYSQHIAWNRMKLLSIRATRCATGDVAKILCARASSHATKPIFKLPLTDTLFHWIHQ